MGPSLVQEWIEDSSVDLKELFFQDGMLGVLSAFELWLEVNARVK